MDYIASTGKQGAVKRVTLDIDRVLWGRLSRLAVKEDRTIRSVVERTLRQGLAKRS